jgi:glutamate-1-semialdehyde aminotransferase
MRYQKSLEYLERAKKVIPGAAQTLSKMPARFPQGAYPVALRRGDGARVWDVDDNKYIDWIGALGAIPLGYVNTKVDFATGFAAGDGLSFSLPYYLEVELAERLCQKIPCAEMVRFVNSGSEATEAAIRTARIATGRDIILTVKDGYHSWHSWFQAVKDWHPGVPDFYRYGVARAPYNDLKEFESRFTIAAEDIAAVILEPCLFEAPNPGFLEGVRELCTKYGALLIFDEMVTGYRWALAGGQEYFKVTPDLATFGKGMANGLPIGMLCGKREYMQHAELISGTFGGNAVSLAAANAVLDVYEAEPVIETMWRRGKELQDFFNNAVTTLQLSEYAICDGYPCKPRFLFLHRCHQSGEVLTHDRAMSLFLQVTAEYGVLFHPGGLNVCAALVDHDMAVTYRAILQGLHEVQRAVVNDEWRKLTGNLIQPVVTVRK